MLADLTRDVFCGGLGGAVGLCVGQPFDVVKTRLHMQPSALAAAATPTAAPPRPSLFSVFASTVRGEGVRGLWRGTTPQLAGVGVYQGTCFMSYQAGAALFEAATSWWGRPTEGVAQTKECIVSAGLVSGTVCTLVITPVDAYKVALQVQPGRTLRELVCDRTVRPFAGLRITLLRDVPSTAVYFLSYETLTRDHGCGAFHAGGVAGVLAWASCTPMDVVKTRIQAAPLRDATVRRVCRELYAENGLRAFTRGLLPVTLRAYPVNGVIFLVYQSLSDMLGTRAS